MTLDELADKLGITIDDTARSAIDGYVEGQKAQLMRTNRELKEEKRSVADKLRKFEALDLGAVAEVIGHEPDQFDLDELPSLIAAVKASSSESGETKDNPMVAELERKLQRAQNQLSETGQENKGKVERLLKAIGEKAFDAMANELIVAAGGNPRLLRSELKNRTKIEVDEDGTVELIPLASNGDTFEDASGRVGTLKDVIESFKRETDLQDAFKATPGGSGQKGSTGSSTPGKSWKEMNLDERAALKEKNPVLAERLKGAA